MSRYVRDVSKESGLYSLLLGEKDGLAEGQARGIAGDLGSTGQAVHAGTSCVTPLRSGTVHSGS